MIRPKQNIQCLYFYKSVICEFFIINNLFSKNVANIINYYKNDIIIQRILSVFRYFLILHLHKKRIKKRSGILLKKMPDRYPLFNINYIPVGNTRL